MFMTKAGSLEVEVVMGRQILGMLLTMYLPTTLMNIIGRLNIKYILIYIILFIPGHATNYMKRFFFEAQVKLS